MPNDLSLANPVMESGREEGEEGIDCEEGMKRSVARATGGEGLEPGEEAVAHRKRGRRSCGS
jgi:hypothetical protein